MGNVRAGSFAALALSYLNSATFKAKRPETRRSERGIINALLPKHGDKPVGGQKGLQQKHVQAMVAAKAETPCAARNLLAVMRTLMEHAIAIEWRKDNPAVGVKRPKIKTPGYRTWEEAQIAAYRAHYSRGTRARLAIEIGLNGGPRRGDAVMLGPRHERDGNLNYVQSKTGAEISVPIMPPLREAIDAMPVRGFDTYLVTDEGKPYTAAGFGNAFRAWCDAVPGLPKGLSFHGLRKAMCRRIAEANLSTKAIMSVSGHKKLAMVERYTEGADKKRMAREAMQAVHAAFEEQPRTSDLHTPEQVSHTTSQALGKKGQ